MSMNGRTTRQRLERLFPSPARKSKNALYCLEKEVLGDDASSEANLSVKERLERLVAVTKARPRPSKAEPPEEPRPKPTLREVLDGETVENERGSFYCVDRVFPLSHHQGRMKLERLCGVSREAFSMLSGGDDGVEMDLTRALFLDTETTGLAGGSGTSAFLVGLGWVEDTSFIVRQLFMRDYAEEPAMLHALADILQRFDILVTYNGKTFDVPLLESRFVLARRRVSFERMLHFDLLHPARSLWRARVESCRLMELEYRLLGLERDEDVPGQLIPELYFRFVRSGDPSRMHGVFHHNRHDILSLAALTVCASDLLDEDHVPDDPVDDVSLGRFLERSSRPERSMRHYSRALEGGIEGAPRRRALEALAGQHKRREEIDEARAIWKELSEEDGASSVEGIRARHELAMLHEHHDSNFGGALALCDDALNELDNNYELPLAFRMKWREAFEHRKKRLERRLRRGG